MAKQHLWTENETQKVESDYRNNVLFRELHSVALRYAAKCNSFFLSAGELFYNTIYSIDEIRSNDNKDERMDYCNSLWNEVYVYLCSGYGKEQDLKDAASLIVIAVAQCLYATNNLKYFDEINELYKASETGNKGRGQKLLYALKNITHSNENIRSWLTDYLSSNLFLSDDIENVISSIREEQDGCQVSNKQKKNTSKQHRKRVKAEEDSEPRKSKVFKINTKKTSESHFRLIYLIITKYCWLKAESEDEFLRLFSGRVNDCVITWIGKNAAGGRVGIGTLKEFFEKMIRKGIVTCPNNEYIAVIESHFKNENDVYLQNVKGSGKANTKTRPQVDDLIKMLTMTLDEHVAQSRGEDYSAPTDDIKDGIDEEFSDQRYGQKQYWDEHKTRK